MSDNHRDLVDLAGRTRRAQMKWRDTQTPHDMELSKSLERQIDKMISDDARQQESLFEHTRQTNAAAETQWTIGEWADAVFPSTLGVERGIRAQALKLVAEAVELALACGGRPFNVERVVTEKLMTRTDPLESLVDTEAARAEMADIAIVLSVLSCRSGVILAAEVDKKMAKNRGRSWTVDPDGSAQHKE